ncbi:MAG: hypothetical protein MK135_08130, partial [Polyangiaceae bacterium]|nr:hypothetical protein [Polyangiaceae bacterium]
SGGAYSAGDRVMGSDNRVYECRPFPYQGWCTSYDPNGPWSSQAWIRRGDCPEAPAPSCPVSTEIPETQSWRTEPCATGRDCQVNHSCTEVFTDASCGHSKCTIGEALEATCDECVSRICDVDSSCCTVAWSQDCTDMVETVCDATCGEVEISGCTHDVCDVGIALSEGCDAGYSDCVAAVCAQSPECCDADGAWTTDCVEDVYELCGAGTSTPIPPIGEGRSVCDYAVLGRGSAVMYSTRILGGDVGWLPGALTMIEFFPGAGRPYVDGTIYSTGTINVTNGDVTGDFIGPLGSTSSGTSIGGQRRVPGNPPIPDFPTQSMNCPTSGSNSTGGSRTVAPGNYGTLAVAGGATLTLEEGVYNVAQFRLNGPNARVQLPASGRVQINVCGAVVMQNRAQVLSPSGDPLQFQVYSKSGNINIGDNSEVYGIFRTDGGNLTTGSDVTVYGMVHSYWGVVYLGAYTVIDSSGFTEMDCLNEGIDPNYPPQECPVTTPDYGVRPTESGSCTANGFEHQVDTDYCADVDLAVDMPCENSIPVCNHGNRDLPAGEAELFFYPKVGQQFANEYPDSSWLVGSCNIDQPIPAGSCVQQVCDSTLLSQDLTVEVQLLESATVEECSILDNWSYYVDGLVCDATPGEDVVVNYTYEAQCPRGSVPAWGVLNWNTETPGGSSIEFRSRASESVAELSAVDFLNVGVASSSPNTQVCNGFTAAGDCPVDLTLALWGEWNVNQPAITAADGTSSSALELEMRLRSSGSEQPVLKDWQVTYTCLIDQ